ncbi:chymotrypsin inhibitor [Aplysia californica]|uniref:Chymotrypsin inhibitor n=1 Tax=Aplysia californica TaxID=6500 RepID=A0ABM1A444_APLCA|nr:chymotrypsin inhibitor [Aplysia californica]
MSDQDQQQQQPKTSWPEAVGKTFEEAEEMIKTDNPFVKQILKVPENSPVTMDYRPDRVRVFVNEAGVTVDVPRTG